MAIQLITVYKIDIEDRPGALQEVLSGAAEANANILNLAAFSIGEGRGAVYFIPDKPEAVKGYAQDEGLKLSEYAGFILSGKDRIGLGAEVAKPVAEAGINVVLSTAAVIDQEYTLLIVVEQADATTAARVLGA